MNYNEKKFLLSKFPQVELCYEKILHNKVRNIDYYITIPFGKKYFAWFKNHNNKNYLFILEIDKKKIKLVQLFQHLVVLKIIYALAKALSYTELFLNIKIIISSISKTVYTIKTSIYLILQILIN